MRLPVLVIGGAGYIGSHAAKALHQAGFEPVLFDNLSRGHRSLARYGKLIEGDIHDTTLLRDVLVDLQPVGCLHFAAFAYVSESLLFPDLYYHNNVGGTLSLLRAMRDKQVDKLVFSSTCAIYGQSDVLPIHEDLPKRPISPYGKSKLMVEEILSDFDAAFGMRSISLRYFNACGADPDCELGEMHNPEPHLFPRAIMAAFGRIRELEINGSDYPTGDGTAVRDYTHVSDLASAHVLALQYLLDGGTTDAFNLGIGRGYSINDVVKSIERTLTREVPRRYGIRRAGDPAEVVADPSKARRVLGFSPQFKELDDMVSTAGAWFRRYGFRED